jgi:hypothetical protein
LYFDFLRAPRICPELEAKSLLADDDDLMHYGDKEKLGCKEIIQNRGSI